jgi:hypothetical protein
MKGGFGAHSLQVHRIQFSMYYGPVHAVLDEAGVVGRTEHALVVGLVVGDQHRDFFRAVQPSGSQLGMFSHHRAQGGEVRSPAEHGLVDPTRP